MGERRCQPRAHHTTRLIHLGQINIDGSRFPLLTTRRLRKPSEDFGEFLPDDAAENAGAEDAQWNISVCAHDGDAFRSQEGESAHESTLANLDARFDHGRRYGLLSWHRVPGHQATRT